MERIDLWVAKPGPLVMWGPDHVTMRVFGEFDSGDIGLDWHVATCLPIGLDTWAHNALSQYILFEGCRCGEGNAAAVSVRRSRKPCNVDGIVHSVGTVT